MTDREVFEKRLRETPFDETLRGVFADWLDEYGDEADRGRAEVLRKPPRLRIIESCSVVDFTKFNETLILASRSITGWINQWVTDRRQEQKNTRTKAALNPLLKTANNLGKTLPKKKGRKK